MKSSFSKLLLAAGLAISLSACLPMSDSKARAALEANGYTDIKIGGATYFGCGQGDTFRSTFTAKGVNGKPISGVVCGGFLKGTTIRLD